MGCYVVGRLPTKSRREAATSPRAKFEQSKTRRPGEAPRGTWHRRAPHKAPLRCSKESLPLDRTLMEQAREGGGLSSCSPSIWPCVFWFADHCWRPVSSGRAARRAALPGGINRPSTRVRALRLGSPAGFSAAPCVAPCGCCINLQALPNGAAHKEPPKPHAGPSPPAGGQESEAQGRRPGLLPGVGVAGHLVPTSSRGLPHVCQRPRVSL